MLYEPKPINSDEILVGELPGWVLTRRHESAHWFNFKLYRTERAEKVVFWLAYNSEENRMADNRDWHALSKHHVKIAQKIIRMVASDAMKTRLF